MDLSLYEQVKQIFASLAHNFTLKITCNSKTDIGKEMIEFFTEFSDTSPRIGVSVTEANTDKAVTEIFRNDVPTGIKFRCIPGGHEFTSLLLAILNADGQGKTLPDESTQNRIRRLKGNIALSTYVSLECTNCPDVVQALNQMALFNDRIDSETVDGNLAVAEAEALKIKSVPTVYANGKEVWVGKGSLGEILDKLEEEFGTEALEQSLPARHFDLLVLGSGPAGASAAIYSARKGLKVGVIAQRVGGQVKETTEITNAISVLRTTGDQLANDLRAHLNDTKVEVFDSRTIEEVDLKGEEKLVKVKGGELFKAPRVIIATGANWRKLNVPGESDFIGHGVAFCVHCDGPFFAQKDVAVIGGGNSGVEAAIDLANICHHVDLFEFMDTIKADEVLQRKLHSLPNVSVHLSQAVTEITGKDGKLTGVEVKDRKDNTMHHFDVEGVFVQIGLLPNSDLFKDQVAVNKMGEIIIDSCCRTDVPGVYGAGDVTTVPYKQIIIAMGEGAKAALSAFDDRTRE